MTDLVVISLEPWDEVWRRNQHLLAGLLRTDPALRVLFVEPATDPLHALTRRARPTPGRGLRRGPRLAGVEDERLWLFQGTKLLPRRLDARSDERLAASVVRAATSLGFDDPVLWVNDPIGASVLRLTGWRALYDITDDWTLADRAEAETQRLVRDEATLLEECAEVVVCSEELRRTKGAHRPVTLIHNAVDVEAYRRPRPRPADLPEGAVAVYVGTVHRDRIDVPLCIDTATALGEAGRLVLVGPAPLDPGDRARLGEAGVVLLGPRPRDSVPAYLQHADVLVVPHLVTPFTDSLDPIKLYEYAAVGRPVVSTAVAGFRDSGDPFVVVAAREEFPAAVRAKIPSTTPFPEGADRPVPTWADRVEQMAEVLGRLSRP
ncbi:hypothetical protein N865_03030 [Intrasporangium oryzae NRRL B-24470]|uniref:Glycosyl transferase n=1 Tax=Intrasporangium oryzae NRRL B-24470 TaxID=1386089 RepID=W9GC27_9MICO|nr:glycosyltransferase [Intrasporangium oryzae]EWT02782.1 hypothetical protein N865_03030 [Intrasporangium oryzae NRRL B-24470]